MRSPIIFGLLCSALLGLFIVGCGSNAQDGPPEAADFTFEIRNTPDALAKIVGIIGSTNYLVDSIMMQAGTVHVKRDTALPAGLYYLVLPGDVVFQFLLDHDQTFTLSADAKDPVKSVEVDGSVDNTLLYESLVWELDFQGRITPLEDKFRATDPTDPSWDRLRVELDGLVQERKAHVQHYVDEYPDQFFTAFKSAGQNPDLLDIRLPQGGFDEEQRVFHYRNAFWDNTPLDDPRLLRTPIIYNKLMVYVTQITPQVHDSVVKYVDILVEKSRVNRDMYKFIVNWIAIEYHEPKLMGMESVFVHVVDKYFTDKDVFWNTPEELKEIRRQVNEMRPSLVGQTGQDMVCFKANGQPESLYSIGGRVQAVFIYSYECEHCQEEAPRMRTIYDAYHDRGLEVYALCTGTDEAQWKAFIEKYGLQPFHNVWDPSYKSDFYRKYHVDNTPECYLLDGQHKIVCKDLKPEQLPVFLDELLK